MRIKSKSIFFIKTGRRSIGERYRIRRMFWSNVHTKKNYFFMLGTNKNGESFGNDTELRMESDLYNDIVIADFIDSYDNLPYKTKVKNYKIWNLTFKTDSIN